MDVALASASEVRYLLGLSRRLGYLEPAAAEELESQYSELLRGLQKLLTALRTRPEA